ncbi:MAG: hypothetical protein CME06_08375 [Gemmatimonadetes bacterium]|nr:hypothetical protein [Gemmatimonadota bacterium]
MPEAALSGDPEMEREMKRLAPALLAGIVIGTFGCGGKSVGVGSIPEWYLSPDTDPAYIVGAGSGESRDLNLAMSEATMEARKKIAQEMEVKVQNLFKKFADETGSSDDAVLLKQISDVSKSVTNTTLRGSKVVKQEVAEISSEAGTKYRAYVLAEISSSALNSTAMQRIKTEEEMYTRFRASQAFQELESATQ